MQSALLAVWVTFGALLALGVVFAIGWYLGTRRKLKATTALVQPPRSNRKSAGASTRSVSLSPPVNTPTLVLPERSQLGRYVLDRQLGCGSMGTVYLAQDEQFDRLVAVKTMALAREFEGRELEDARARFFREAEMAGRLRHPEIVSIYDTGEERGLAFIAMEYVKGHDLLRYTLPGRLLPVTTVLTTLERVARALAHAHSQGIVHRDIKPANVMIDPQNDTLKVTDFGIARITDACRTRTGLVLGTPSFMSPEQMAGRRVDGRTDLYSLGVMLYQLLTGALPHPSESMAQLMYQIANEPAPDIRLLRPELSEALANVVALALEKRPEMRYADGVEMAGDLHAVAKQIAAEPASAPSSTNSDERETDSFEATVRFSRVDPRHNAGY